MLLIRSHVEGSITNAAMLNGLAEKKHPFTVCVGQKLVVHHVSGVEGVLDPLRFRRSSRWRGTFRDAYENQRKNSKSTQHQPPRLAEGRTFVYALR